MSLLQKARAGRYRRFLRCPGGLSPRSLAEVRPQFKALGPAGVRLLIESLASAETCRAAGQVLETLLTDETLPEYLEAVSAQAVPVGQAVAGILGRGQGYDPNRLVDLLLGSRMPVARLEEILSAQLPRIKAASLLTRLPEFSREARPVVSRLLERHVDEGLVAEAVRLADHPEWWIRRTVARLLGGHSDPAGLAAAIRLLGDEQRTVRLEAVRALGRLRAPAAVSALCNALRDPDLKVHTASIDALVAIGDVSAVARLVEVLKDESEYARRGAVEVLNEVVTVEAIKDLIHALRDEDWWVRVRAADALGTLGGERVVDAVLGLLTDPDEFIRRYAVEILNTVSDSRAVDHLIRSLDDGDWWVRERSVDALARIGDPRAVEPLIQLLSRDVEAAPLCIRALRDLGDPRAIETLVRLVDSERAELRREAMEALVAFSRRSLDSGDWTRVSTALEQMGVHPERARTAPLGVQARSAAQDPGQGRPGAREDQGRRRPGLDRGVGTASAGGGTAPSAGATASSSHAGAAPPAGDGVCAPSFGLSNATPPLPELARSRPLNYRDLEHGQMLVDRFRVIKKIGGGAFGTVYLVEDMIVRENLILKILNPFLCQEEAAIHRFAQELRLARRISHPNVIRIHDLLDLGGVQAISMEYLPGRDLARELKDQGRLGPNRAVRIAGQVCDGLNAAHDQGIIHRDIKPGNVLLGPHDLAKIVDFGLAAVGQQLGSRLTRSGLLIGTPEYMAPEQINGGSVDARVDLYSLGVMMYEMLAGRPPFSGDNPVHVLFQHLEAEVPPLSLMAPGLPEPLVQAVMSAMARNRDDRPATAAELRHRLDEVTPDLGAAA